MANISDVNRFYEGTTHSRVNSSIPSPVSMTAQIAQDKFSKDHIVHLCNNGNVNEAIAIAKEAMQLNPPPSWAASFLSTFMSHLPASVQPPREDPKVATLTKLHSNFCEHYKAKKFNEMIATLKEALEIDPNHSWFQSRKTTILDLLKSKATHFQQLRQYKHLSIVVNKVLQVDPTLAWALELKSTLDISNLKANAEALISEKNYTKL